MNNAGTLEAFAKNDRPLSQRLLEKIVIAKSGCWEWIGMKNEYGYGIIWKNGKTARAHRESYRCFVNEFDSKLVVCHSCDNPCCINPAHLFVGTSLINSHDSMNKNRNAFGERNGHAKLTVKQVNEIRLDERPQLHIARDYKISQSHVSRIKTGNVRKKG